MGGVCGRYAASRNPDDLVEEFEVERVEVRERLEPDYNVAPTKPVYAVLTRRSLELPEGSPAVRQLRVVSWGLVPSWAKDPTIGSRLINARMETLAEKPAFRRAFAKRRCLLPADGYYEWYAGPGSQVGGKAAKKQPTAAPAAKKPVAKAKAKAKPARADSKKAIVIKMLQRKNGASNEEIMAATGWQTHSVRGFIAGTLKKAGLTAESFKTDAGERRYRLPA